MPIPEGQSPFEKLFRMSPDYNFLRTFSCACYPNFTVTSANKLEPRFTHCLLLGYARHYTGYKCFGPITGRVFVSCHMIFYEHEFPCLEFFSNPHSAVFGSLGPSPECLVELSHLTPTAPVASSLITAEPISSPPPLLASIPHGFASSHTRPITHPSLVSSPSTSPSNLSPHMASPPSSPRPKSPGPPMSNPSC